MEVLQDHAGTSYTRLIAVCYINMKEFTNQNCKHMLLIELITLILLYYYTIILLYYYTIILLYYYTIILLYYYTIILLYYYTIILLYYYTIILLYYYTIILLYYYTIILLYYYTIILLYYYTIYTIILLYYYTIILLLNSYNSVYGLYFMEVILAAIIDEVETGDHEQVKELLRLFLRVKPWKSRMVHQDDIWSPEERGFSILVICHTIKLLDNFTSVRMFRVYTWPNIYHFHLHSWVLLNRHVIVF